MEVIKILGERFEFDLGPGLHLCDQTHHVLSAGITDQSLNVLWNTGETTSEIDVTQSGMYWVKITGECNVGIDTVSVQFDTHPVVFLGIDEQLCEFEPRVIKPMDNPEGFELTWNDGSNGPSKEVNEFGVYWVTAKNLCGIVSDTISITKKILGLENIPNVITPNGDQLNDVFIVTKDSDLSEENVSIKICNRWGQEVFTSSDYKNDWDGLNLSSGVYFYQVYGECASEKKGTITILR